MSSGRRKFCALPSRYSRSALNVVDDGDLIFSWSATLKVALALGKAALNQHLFKVQPNPGVDKDYLYQLSSTWRRLLAAPMDQP